MSCVQVSIDGEELITHFSIPCFLVVGLVPRCHPPPPPTFLSFGHTWLPKVARCGPDMTIDARGANSLPIAPPPRAICTPIYVSQNDERDPPPLPLGTLGPLLLLGRVACQTE